MACTMPEIEAGCDDDPVPSSPSETRYSQPAPEATSIMRWADSAEPPSTSAECLTASFSGDLLSRNRPMWAPRHGSVPPS